MDNGTSEKKWLYRLFGIVGIIFLQFQITQLWRHRHRQEVPKVQGQPDTRPTLRSEAEKKHPPVAKPTPISVGHQGKVASGLPVSPDPGKIKKIPPPTPIPAPSPSPALKFSTLSREAQSRLFVYFIEAKKQIRIDLLYDLYPTEVGQFISEMARCPNKEKTPVKLSIKWKNIAPSEKSQTSEYMGFLFMGNPTKDKKMNFLLLDPSQNVPQNFKLVGGVTSIDVLKENQNSEEDLIYHRSNILFTYTENEDSNAQHEVFRKMLEYMKTGCKK